MKQPTLFLDYIETVELITHRKIIFFAYLCMPIKQLSLFLYVIKATELNPGLYLNNLAYSSTTLKNQNIAQSH
jgi:hypothetical protein